MFSVLIRGLANAWMTTQPLPSVVQTPTPPSTLTGEGESPIKLSQPMVIRVNFLEFYADKPIIGEGDYVIDGIVKDENGKTLVVGRPPYTRYIPLEWMDLVIRKDIPEKGDKVFITLYLHTHSADRMVDINPSTVWWVPPRDIWETEGRALTIEYVIGDVTEGWGGWL